MRELSEGNVPDAVNVQCQRGHLIYHRSTPLPFPAGMFVWQVYRPGSLGPERRCPDDIRRLVSGLLGGMTHRSGRRATVLVAPGLSHSPNVTYFLIDDHFNLNLVESMVEKW